MTQMWYIYYSDKIKRILAQAASKQMSDQSDSSDQSDLNQRFIRRRRTTAQEEPRKMMQNVAK